MKNLCLFLSNIKMISLVYVRIYLTNQTQNINIHDSNKANTQIEQTQQPKSNINNKHEW